MTKSLQRTTLITLLISLIFLIASCNTDTNKNISMTGSNDLWSAYLHMNTGYNNELIVSVIAEQFEPPSEIFVDLLVKEKSVYSTQLKRVKKDDFPDHGEYKSRFDSIPYLEKNYEDVTIIVGINENETIMIPIKSIEVIE